VDKFKIVAKTLQGLEEQLATEIQALGGINIAVGTRMVSFLGDKALLYKANLWLRTALRVLKPVTSFHAGNPDELYEAMKQIDWHTLIAPGQTIAIDATINSDAFRHSKFAIYRAKDAICDFFTDRGEKRPTVSVSGADIQLNLHISDEDCTLSLDSSGEPLYKRGYKEQQTDAPISEVLAAGILLKAGWNGDRDLIDPMCGSGTFLIEAALIACNLPAGICRKDFGFEHWRVGDLAFDEELWHTIYNDDSQERPFEHHIYGSDISKPVIDITTENVKSAGLSKYISLEVKDFETYEEAPSKGCMMVCNPPYGRRLFTDVPTFYKMMGRVLKRAFQDCEAWIISTEEEPFSHIGLKPSLRFSLNNGGLDCELRKYEMFKGRFDEFRAEGNALDKSEREENSKFTHIHQERKKFPRRDREERGDRGDRAERGERKRFDRGDHKPFDKDKKPFDRDRKFSDHKPFDKDKKSFDRDKKPFDRDHKPFDKKRFDRDGQKPYEHERRPRVATGGEGDFKYEPRGNFRRNDDGKIEEREGNFRVRGERKFNPNRPMFHKNFDVNANILDFTKKEDNNASSED
jgi:putative N6-adenine-specific DNA methylase